MKALISITSVAILALMEAANAQGAAPKQLFFEGDLVRGAQQGAPGPFCVSGATKLVAMWPALSLLRVAMR